MTTRNGDISDTFGSGGANLVPGQGVANVRDALRGALGSWAPPYADTTALTASLAKDRVDGQVVTLLVDYSQWTWKAADATPADSNHIAPTDVGVGNGRWVSEALAPGGLAGPALTDAAATITVAQGKWRTLPAATLTAGRILTLGTTGAVAGDQIEITRLDATANTYTIVDGGSGTPTIFTMAASKLGYVRAQFDGAHWVVRAFGVQ